MAHTGSGWITIILSVTPYYCSALLAHQFKRESHVLELPFLTTAINCESDLKTQRFVDTLCQDEV